MKTESVSPWYNSNGWLGVKHQVTYLKMQNVLLLVCQDWGLNQARMCYWLCVYHTLSRLDVKCHHGKQEKAKILQVLLLFFQVSFTETSKFQTVVSVAHAARVCGHRFRANAAACHPVLPLLLTTSHHNLPDPATSPERETTPEENEDNKNRTAAAGSFAFCSELILWQVRLILFGVGVHLAVFNSAWNS